MRSLVQMMRFTVIDSLGTASFAGPGHGLKILVAGCSRGPETLNGLLEVVRRYDMAFVDRVRGELARFDEHVVRDDQSTIDDWLDQRHAIDQPAFRVFDQRLRNLSLLPEKLGIVLFNLPEQRIVQIQNAYGEVLRRDRGRIRERGAPVNRYYHYDLPSSWQLLP
ncbi:MAG: hypothetical protein IT335_07275 [Thermomicrobiales bacterium]|nr:hypothetical protein [Thermomicrobiales bacterium]